MNTYLALLHTAFPGYDSSIEFELMRGDSIVTLRVEKFALRKILPPEHLMKSAKIDIFDF